MPSGRLLIIDDDPAIGQTICLIARRAGLEAMATDCPDAFFEALGTFDPTHIALDLVMPRMDGVELMVQLARRRCQARIIITSGLGSRVLDAAGRTASENGLVIAGILSKPFAPAALRELLESAAGEVKDAGQKPTPALEHVSEAELREGIEKGQVYPVYQPKIDCRSGCLAGFEALARWSHPSRGAVMPDQFIPLAEQAGLIDELTHVMLDAALPWFAAQYADSDVTLAINLSARTASRAAADGFGDGSDSSVGFFGRVEPLCQTVGLSPERLIFELTETSAMEDPVASLSLLTRLRMKGFQLSLDDFGTGFSSMLQLVRLPFSEIKVDRSFVMTAARSQESRTVIRSVVDLGRSLGLKSTAEGVEDSQTLGFLNEIGCDLAQGYFIARPMPAEQAAAWAQARSKPIP